MKFVNNLEVNGNQLVDARLQMVAGDPVGMDATDEARVWYDGAIVKVHDGLVVHKLTNVLESVTGSGAITVGAVVGKAQAVSIAAASASTLGTMSMADFNKLVGITTGATANATDAFLLARGNQTGTQLHSTISDFDVEVNALVATGITGKANTASPAFTGTPTGITKAHVGLSSVDNTTDVAKPVSTAAAAAIALKANAASPAFTGTPTGLTKAHVGLTSVDNTTDAAKPVSTATQTALNAKADLVGGLVPTSQLPALVMGTVVVVASQAAMLALTTAQVQPGDLASRSDGAGTFMLTATDPSLIGSWTPLNAPTGSVTSVNTQTGTVVLGKADVGLGSVDNTTDAAKPVSTATATALGLKAPLASPAFTGTPTGITASHVGLGSVNNTADSAKPVSTAQAAADALSPLKTNNLSDLVGPDSTIRANIGAVGKYAIDIGNNVLTSCPVTHSLNTQDVTVNVLEKATMTQVIVDIVHTSVNVVTIVFASAPATAAYRVIVTG